MADRSPDKNSSMPPEPPLLFGTTNGEISCWKAGWLAGRASASSSTTHNGPPDAGAWGGNCDGLTALLIERDALAVQVAALLDEKARSAIGALRPEVIAFARAMQFKLDKNAKKKGWPEQDQHGDRGWKSCPPMFLECKLEEEVRELLEALLGSDIEAIRCEAADVGNIAMMLADNAGALGTSDDTDEKNVR